MAYDKAGNHYKLTCQPHLMITFEKAVPYNLYRLWVKEKVSGEVCLHNNTSRYVVIEKSVMGGSGTYAFIDNLKEKFQVTPNHIFEHYCESDTKNKYDIDFVDYIDGMELETGKYFIRYKIESPYNDTVYWDIVFYNKLNGIFYQYSSGSHINCWVAYKIQHCITQIAEFKNT